MAWPASLVEPTSLVDLLLLKGLGVRLDVDISGVTEHSTAMSHESHVLDRTLPSDPRLDPSSKAQTSHN